MSARSLFIAAALCAAAGTVTSAQAQWLPNYRYYSIQRIGLFGPAQTGSTGLQSSSASHFSNSRFVAGTSEQYTGVNTSNGRDAWSWNGSTTTQIGLTGQGYTGSAGYQFSESRLQNAAGQVAGVSRRITGVRTTARMPGSSTARPPPRSASLAQRTPVAKGVGSVA